MRSICLILSVAFVATAAHGVAQEGSLDGPYKVLKATKVGGEGGFDYVYADAVD